MNEAINKTIAELVEKEKENVARYASDIIKRTLQHLMVNHKLVEPYSIEEIAQWGKNDLNEFRKHYGLPELSDNLMSAKK